MEENHIKNKIKDYEIEKDRCVQKIKYLEKIEESCKNLSKEFNQAYDILLCSVKGRNVLSEKEETKIIFDKIFRDQANEKEELLKQVKYINQKIQNAQEKGEKIENEND